MTDHSPQDIKNSAASAAQANEPAGEETRVHKGLDDLEGEVISGRYLIIRRIGKGGMGVVYLAQQTNLNRNICLKVLNPALLDDADAVGRFEREAKGLSRLQHPNIVTIFDYGRDGNLAYIAMEYAQGMTLSKYIKTNAPINLDAFLPIAVQILKGIADAHKLGLIHRDIKPANIILSELDGEKNFVKILDFGLAKLAQGQEDLTKEQQLVGSASYMAPEQIVSGHSDTRTDVYALGILFYLMLSGNKPFSGPNDNVILYKHVNETPSPLISLIESSQGVPEKLCDVIDQCLDKDPDKRPQNAAELLSAIAVALDSPQICSGFSSMGLASIDPQKIADDAETKIINHQPKSDNKDAEAKDKDILSKDLSSELSDISSVSSVSSVSFISGEDSGVSTFTASQLAQKQKNNLRLIIILAICIAVVVGLTLLIVYEIKNQQRMVNNDSAMDETVPLPKTQVAQQEDETEDVVIPFVDPEQDSGVAAQGELQAAEDFPVDDNGLDQWIAEAADLEKKLDFNAALEKYEAIRLTYGDNAVVTERIQAINDMPGLQIVFAKKNINNFTVRITDSLKNEFRKDYKSQKELPEVFSFPEGDYKITITSSGYDAFHETISLKELLQQEPVVINVKLNKKITNADGTLR